MARLFRGVCKFSHLEIVPGGTLVSNYNGAFDVGGRTYYVNNITGDSGKDGLTWANAMDQPSTAIAASETYRELKAATNEYIANRIVIQATGTAYTGLTDLGERCVIIGLSAGLMRDGGSGQVRIGTSTTDGFKNASGHVRGNTLYNLQFQGGGAGKYAFYATEWIQRCRFQDVTFMAAGASMTALFYSGFMSGTIMERCTVGDNQGGVKPTSGFNVNGQFSDNLIMESVFCGGRTRLFLLGSGSHQVGSVIDHNWFFPVSNTAVAVGFEDASADGYAMLSNNAFATTNLLTDQISRNINYRTVNNWSASADSPIDS